VFPPSTMHPPSSRTALSIPLTFQGNLLSSDSKSDHHQVSGTTYLHLLGPSWAQSQLFLKACSLWLPLARWANNTPFIVEMECYKKDIFKLVNLSQRRTNEMDLRDSGSTALKLCFYKALTTLSLSPSSPLCQIQLSYTLFLASPTLLLSFCIVFSSWVFLAFA
jgi:hypothetical protein